MKLFILKDIHCEESHELVGNMINRILCSEEEWVRRHYSKEYKYYVFDNLFPIEKNKVYRKHNMYSVRMRTSDPRVYETFEKHCRNYEDAIFKLVFVETREIKDMNIVKVYSLSPFIIKNDSGYWRDNMSFSEFEKRIKDNILKKYNLFHKTNIKNHDFYNLITLDNGGGIKMKYKDIILLGDKITLTINSDPLSQKIANFILGTGIGENNSTLGAGFMNYHKRRV